MCDLHAETNAPAIGVTDTFLTFLLLRKSSMEVCLESPRRPGWWELIGWAGQADLHFPTSTLTGLPETSVKQE